MTVSDHFVSFAAGAVGVGVGAGVVAGVVAAGSFGGVASAAGAATAAGIGVGTGLVAATGYIGAAAPEQFKPVSAIAGAMTSVCAAAFLMHALGGPAPEAPVTPAATGAEIALNGIKTCKDIQPPFASKDGASGVELTRPPGCSLRPR